MNRPEGGTLEGIRVLLVEDDADSREFMVLMLGSLGAKAKAVDSVLAAINELRSELYDIILSDIRMPGADGFELIRRVRRGDSGRKSLPAVAITGLSGKDCTLALEADYQACLTKPVDPSTLAQIILRLVRRSRTQHRIP